MKWKFEQRLGELVWFYQEILPTSLNRVYGREILCRGYVAEQPIAMPTLLEYLYQHPQLLLDMTLQQVLDTHSPANQDIAVLDAHLQKTDREQSPKPTEQSDSKSTVNHSMESPTPLSTWINIAGQLIADSHLFDQLWANALQDLNDQQKQNLVLEICEHDINNHQMLERLSFLKSHGFTIAMDDFGSGHSNLLRLTQIPFDIIKLDLKLLNDVPSDLWAASFYREIVDLCSSKGCLILAEGVETQAQSDFVRWAGVDLLQGFLYSTPSRLALPDKNRIETSTPQSLPHYPPKPFV